MNKEFRSETTHLIIVPGHAIYEGTCAADTYDASKWHGTYSGYRYQDEVANYVRHIQRGINLADRDAKAVLVFSGGVTRKIHKAEAASYFELAEQNLWFGASQIEDRARQELYALDSFENLLFSIQLYQSLHPEKQCPRKVTVVGLRFKSTRYHFHAETIIGHVSYDIPPFVFRYDDVNDIPDYVLLEGSQEGEELTLLQFRRWPLGDAGELLKKKGGRRQNQPPDHPLNYDNRPYPN